MRSGVRLKQTDAIADLTQAAHPPTIDGRFRVSHKGELAMTFDAVPNAPQDPILGLNDAFRADPNPRKVNLSVGVYKDASGKTPIMPCVKEAEGRILAQRDDQGLRQHPGLAGVRAVRAGSGLRPGKPGVGGRPNGDRADARRDRPPCASPPTF